MKIICFDIDNVICKTVKSNYIKSKPIKKNIRFINHLYYQGHTIKIFTARYMGRTGDNAVEAKKKAKKKLGWFPTYNIKNSVKITTEWYLKVFKKRKSPFDVTNEQIKNYMNENNWT